MPALDPDRTAHEGRCRRCQLLQPVLLSECRLECRPWRLVWRCPNCGALTNTRVHKDALAVLLQMDRAGGMPVSVRESMIFALATPQEVYQALVEEVLP